MRSLIDIFCSVGLCNTFVFDNNEILTREINRGVQKLDTNDFVFCSNEKYNTKKKKEKKTPPCELFNHVFQKQNI